MQYITWTTEVSSYGKFTHVRVCAFLCASVKVICITENHLGHLATFSYERSMCLMD